MHGHRPDQRSQIIRLGCLARAFWRPATARIAPVVAKGQSARLAYISEFIEEIKASGFVQQVITRSGWRGVQVAPPASPNRDSSR